MHRNNETSGKSPKNFKLRNLEKRIAIQILLSYLNIELNWIASIGSILTLEYLLPSPRLKGSEEQWKAYVYVHTLLNMLSIRLESVSSNPALGMNAAE